jgi:hypothetical protein
MAFGDRGVVALPYLSVWVIKSGKGSFFAATLGDFRPPGERKSEPPRVHARAEYFGDGVEAAVDGVPLSELYED